MMADQQVDIQFRDANSQEIDSKTVVTDKMGMASAQFVIPKGRLNGNFRIRFGDESTYVRVEEYKRPTFDIEFESQTGTLAFGDTAKVTVEIEEYKIQPNGTTKISGLILVEREGQKKMIIGAGGEKLKTIGTEARKDLENMLESKVFLQLWVKVKSGWADDERALRSLGYMDFMDN